MTTKNARLGYLLVVSASVGLCGAATTTGWSADQSTVLLVGAAFGIVGGALLYTIYSVVRYTVHLIAGVIAGAVFGFYTGAVDFTALSQQERDSYTALFRWMHQLACGAILVTAAFALYHYAFSPLYTSLNPPSAKAVLTAETGHRALEAAEIARLAEDSTDECPDHSQGCERERARGLAKAAAPAKAAAREAAEWRQLMDAASARITAMEEGK